MILAASELELGEDSAGILVLDDEPRRRDAAGRGAADRRAGAGAGGDADRVDCFGVYGVAREVHAISAAPLAAEPWAEDAPAEGEGEVERLRLGDGRGARALPALHRARLHRRHDRPLAGSGCRRG